MAGVILIELRTYGGALSHQSGTVTDNMFLNIRSMAFHKITHADVGVLESKFRTGDIATRITTDIDYLSSFVAGSVSDFSRRIFQAAFAIIGCFFLSWQLSLIYCVILPVSLWAIKKVSVPFRAQSKRSLDATGAAMNTASDAISGILTVKAFGLENERTEKFHGSVQRACAETEKSEKTNMKMTGVKYVATVIQTMALFLLGSVLVTNGTITVGTMIAFITLSSYINDPFSMMDYMISTVKRASATAQRIYEVLDIPDEKVGSVKSIVFDEPCAAEDITFSYTEEKANFKLAFRAYRQESKGRRHRLERLRQEHIVKSYLSFLFTRQRQINTVRRRQQRLGRRRFAAEHGDRHAGRAFV